MAKLPKCPIHGIILAPDVCDVLEENGEYIILSREGYCDECRKTYTWTAEYRLINFEDIEKKDDWDDEEED